MEIRDLILTNRFPESCLENAHVSDLSTSLDQLWTLDSSKSSEIEAILMAFGRPKIPITDGNVHRTNSEVINARLHYQPQKLSSAITRVGLIKNTSEATVQTRLCETAWFVSPNTIATTKKVAMQMKEFQTSGFRSAPSQPSDSYTITLEGIKSEIEIKRPLHISEKEDFALFETEDSLEFDFRDLSYEQRNCSGSSIAIIGYTKPTLSNTYSKVIIPGKILHNGDLMFYHDCPMDGMTDGSMVVNLSTGNIIGMHITGCKVTDYRASSLSPILKRLKTFS